MDALDIAKNTFTIAALLLTASLIFLNYAFKRLKNIMRTMPKEKRRITLFRYKSIAEPSEAEKYSYIDVQFVSVCLFVFATVGALIAVSQMSGFMTGDFSGPYAADNFDFAVVSMRVGVYCLFMGAFLHGALYMEDIASLIWGQPSRIMTKLEELPKPLPTNKARSNLSFGWLISTIVITGVVNIFIKSNQWVKMALSLVFMV